MTFSIPSWLLFVLLCVLVVHNYTTLRTGFFELYYDIRRVRGKYRMSKFRKRNREHRTNA